jgi:hypothetical protein
VKGKLNALKHHYYAHIEIKMYKSDGQDFSDSQIIWNVPAENIPSGFDYKTGVRTSLIYFLDLLSSLKGEGNTLVFEINNASFHSIDSGRISDYQYATAYAIVDCFDKNILKFNQDLASQIIESYKSKSRVQG